MKVAPIVVFLFRDTEGFASTISQAFRPKPSSSFTRQEDSFELSLEAYGIKHLKASGSVSHFVDDHGAYKVTIVAMEHYEPPVLSCALNEVLNKITADKSSFVPTLLVPFLVESSKVKGHSKSLRSDEIKPLIFGIKIGQNTDIMQALLNKIQEPPSSLRIQHETFACFLHFVRVMQLPTFFLIGQASQYLDNKSTKQQEILHAIGEILASTTDLQFSEDRVVWNPKKASGESKEPWRALYG
ncbi:hypothetical protein AAZX31_09G081400 [Glycine max]|uniref:DUF7894 domain-containing protein n=2 Tax=Glycine subgen. Soja TaxID=1462606 RepID=C6TKE9_SOYBN|nr:uncharacterized protein LOC100781998 [Glycine max]XP_028247543.1 uncharacterized protein LOC114425021 isoform X1 [Glycine soja]ACU23389.1 unknown [Glycine max]KAG4990943.1 hypothetical protein JHK87_024400 [Glycine soja]KAG5012260.1 hypothetical protein JHK86_024521 [Glycine max]KAG5133238.1 hypothetical protein JHK82_024426 [Glycine max]KAH1042140.1 hypothetical protein GYH30_024448 [Glycine max]|eukprot:NP_001241187.1 uncharacterized protein LOC100781998 [Glycine max]